MSTENQLEDTLREKFENFLFHFDESLALFINKLKKQGINLDYSKESLKLLESYLVKEKIKFNDDSDDYENAAMYVGEYVRKNHDGTWICNLDEENNSLYYGFPVVIDHTDSDLLYSPFHVVKAFLIRHKENLLLSSIESQVNPKEIDWSGMPEED